MKRAKIRKPGKNDLPFCKSELLQDVIIALGRRSLKSLRAAYRDLTFNVTTETIGESDRERFDIEAISWVPTGCITKISIWDDGSAWAYFRKQKSVPQGQAWEIRANLGEMEAENVANLIRATLSDIEAVKEVWQKLAFR